MYIFQPITPHFYARKHVRAKQILCPMPSKSGSTSQFVWSIWKQKLSPGARKQCGGDLWYSYQSQLKLKLTHTIPCAGVERHYLIKLRIGSVYLLSFIHSIRTWTTFDTRLAELLSSVRTTLDFFVLKTQPLFTQGFPACPQLHYSNLITLLRWVVVVASVAMSPISLITDIQFTSNTNLSRGKNSQILQTVIQFHGKFHFHVRQPMSSNYNIISTALSSQTPKPVVSIQITSPATHGSLPLKRTISGNALALH